MTVTVTQGQEAPFRYDGDANALYYSLADGQVAKTVCFGDRVCVDVDADGNPLGIEVLNPPGFGISVISEGGTRDYTPAHR